MSDNHIMDEVIDKNENLTEKQKLILEAAIESFAEKGYAATSTSEIAKKAGVAEGTIFRHYKTKKDLLLSIVAPMMAKLIAPFVIKDLNKVLNQDFESLEDFLRAMIQNRAEFLNANIPLFKIILQELPFQPELQKQFKEHIAIKVYERMEAIIKHYQEAGQLIDLPPYQVVRMTASSIFGFLIGRYLLFPELDWDDEQEIEATIQFILHGLAPKEKA
jgi:AcrR family transcriptional regulator